jgi:outer membrane protein TolC
MVSACMKRLLATAVIGCALIAPAQAQNPPGPAQQANIVIDVKSALERAHTNSPQLQSAALGVDLAREDRHLARTAFYPTLDYFNQYLYTQGNGTPSGIWVPNDGVHLYASHATVHQELYSPARMAEYRRSIAGEALAIAKRDVAARGIVSTVFQNYYGLVTSQRHHANAQQSLEEARRFFEITEKLERGGEVARADVVKAQLTLQQRERDVQEARLAIEKARVSLAVLIFPDYRTDFEVVDDLASVAALPDFEPLQALASETSPDLRAAQQTLRQEEFGISVARSAYLPSLSFDYFYGLQANQFATRDSEDHNLWGSVAQATLNIPVFNWGATRSKIRQAELKRQQAQLDLVLTQRELNSNLRSSYIEAQTALAELNSLKHSMDLSAESLRLTNLRYQAGEVAVLEVVDAQSTLAQARNAYDDGLSRYRLALANVQTLTGNY